MSQRGQVAVSFEEIRRLDGPALHRLLERGGIDPRTAVPVRFFDFDRIVIYEGEALEGGVRHRGTIVGEALDQDRINWGLLRRLLIRPPGMEADYVASEVQEAEEIAKRLVPDRSAPDQIVTLLDLARQGREADFKDLAAMLGVEKADEREAMWSGTLRRLRPAEVPA